MNASLAAMLQRLDDPGFLHRSPSFTEALARLHFCVDHRQGLVALVGASGVGKTTLLRRFRRELAASPACVVMANLAGATEPELRTAFAEQLGIRVHRTWSKIAERLTEFGFDQTQLIVLADNAVHMLPEAFGCLARLWEADRYGQLRTTMVLATEELALAQWPDSWLSRVDLRMELERWSLDDVRQFLTAIVGEEAKRRRGFEPNAVERIHELSGGLPRITRRIAQLSLLATEELGHPTVDEATVTGVSHELCRVAVPHHDGPAIEFLDDSLGQ